MTREEILTRALAIAKRKGFDVSEDFFTETSADIWLRPGQDLYFSLIFDHNFAKCFFSEDFLEIEGFDENAFKISLSDVDNPMSGLIINRENMSIPLWEYHLIQMVLSKDPLSYIANFIKEYEQAESN